MINLRKKEMNFLNEYIVNKVQSILDKIDFQDMPKANEFCAYGHYEYEDIYISHDIFEMYLPNYLEISDPNSINKDGMTFASWNKDHLSFNDFYLEINEENLILEVDEKINEFLIYLEETLKAGVLEIEKDINEYDFSDINDGIFNESDFL